MLKMLKMPALAQAHYAPFQAGYNDAKDCAGSYAHAYAELAAKSEYECGFAFGLADLNKEIN